MASQRSPSQAPKSSSASRASVVQAKSGRSPCSESASCSHLRSGEARSRTPAGSAAARACAAVAVALAALAAGALMTVKLALPGGALGHQHALAKHFFKHLHAPLPADQSVGMGDERLAHQVGVHQVPGVFVAQAHAGQVAMLLLQPGHKAKVICTHVAQQGQAPPAAARAMGLQGAGGLGGHPDRRGGWRGQRGAATAELIAGEAPYSGNADQIRQGVFH